MMNTYYHILALNPGSTSTKLAIYGVRNGSDHLELFQKQTLLHTGGDLDQTAQLDMRIKAVDQFLSLAGLEIDLIMARSAPLKPLKGGIYAVNELMLKEIQSQKYSAHASNYAALIGDRLGRERSIPVYITDPITTDELMPEARISGVPGIERKSRSHALNIKASLRKVCLRQKLDFDSSSWVVCHMGGGISVAAVRSGRLVDVNDALLGMGPFSPERAGALPLAGMLDLVFNSKRDRKAMETLLSKESGLKGYLGTADLEEVEGRMAEGDTEATLIFEAMSYQIAKEIAAMASVLHFNLDGIVLTGGMAHSERLCESLGKRLSRLSQIYIEAGENELEALAQAGLRVLQCSEEVLEYV